MSNYGMKVVEPGKNITSKDPRDWILNSDYPTLNIYKTYTGSITLNAGDTTGYFEIEHHLGYTPAFLVHLGETDSAYATNTKIRVTCNLSTPYNQTTTRCYGDQAFWEHTAAGFHVIAGDSAGDRGSALRFTDIPILQGQDLDAAQLNYTLMTLGTHDVKFTVAGIDEDNTAEFGDPMGRTKTSAINNKTQSQQGSFFGWSDNVLTQVQEIVDRFGWSSGNALGFLFNDNGSESNECLITRHTDNFNSEEIFLDLTYTTSGSITYTYNLVVFENKIAG